MNHIYLVVEVEGLREITCCAEPWTDGARYGGDCIMFTGVVNTVDLHNDKYAMTVWYHQCKPQDRAVHS